MTNTFAPRLTRRAAVLLSPLIYSLARATPAWAAGGGTAGALWMGIADSSGVPVELYGLSLNNGSLADPTAAPPALSMHWIYSLYLAIVTVPVWMVRNVESFHWLEIIAAPFDFLGNQLTAMVHSPAVVLAVGTIAAAIIGVMIAIGRLSRSVAMIITALVLAYLSIALGAKPLDALIGPSGLLTSGRDMGIEAAAELSGKPGTGQSAVDAQSASLADNFIRIPTQEINFGADIDAAPYNCGPAWSNAIKAGDVDKVKDAVATCNNGAQLHDYAMADPTSRKLLVFFALIFAVTVLIVFGFLSILVVILALSSIFWFMVAIVALVTGWIPGKSQDLAIKAALDGIFSLCGMIGFTAITGITSNLTGAMFVQAEQIHSGTVLGGDAIVVAMPTVTLLLIALVIAIWKVRRGLVSGRERAVRAIRAFTGHSRPIDTATLDRFDPLTAIPTATHRLTRLATNSAKTAAKAGISIAAPEAAPFLQAADGLQSRVNATNLKNARAAKRSTAQTSQTTPKPAQAPTASRIHPTSNAAASQPDSPQATPQSFSDNYLRTRPNEPVDAMNGVGPVTKSKLAELGITTIGQLASSDEALLKRTFGPQQGSFLKLLASDPTANATPTLAQQQGTGNAIAALGSPAQTISSPRRADQHPPGPATQDQGGPTADHRITPQRLHPAILAIARDNNSAIATQAIAVSNHPIRPTPAARR